NSIAGHFRNGDSPATRGTLFRLQNQKGSSLAQDQSRAILVKRTDFFRGSSLERIEADKNKLAQRLVASTHDTITQPMPDELESVPNCIGTRGTGVGENL